MKASIPIDTNDPCLPIQADLSAMLDGELDAAVVRRVMVHSDVCPSCSKFLQGIRNQARAHRELAACRVLDAMASGEVVLDGPAPDAGDDRVSEADGRMPSGAAKALRQRLLENRRQLAKILYELGRGFVLMGVNPSFSRVVAREPVPVPDMCLRGRNLLDEVERLSIREQIHVGQEWVRAKVLFSQREVRSPVENLVKGKRLLFETLLLWHEYHEARIYLGHAYQVEEDHESAIGEFTTVLSLAKNLVIRAFALENLGNLHMGQGRFDDAIRLFDQLVGSGVIDQEPRFFTTFFNLALAHGFRGDFESCEHWLGVLDQRFPHKRRVMAAEFAKRAQFATVVARRDDVSKRFAARFPTWFQSGGDA